MNVLLQCDGDKALLLHSGKRVGDGFLLYCCCPAADRDVENYSQRRPSQIENKTSDGISYIYSRLHLVFRKKKKERKENKGDKRIDRVVAWSCRCAHRRCLLDNSRVERAESGECFFSFSILFLSFFLSPLHPTETLGVQDISILSSVSFFFWFHFIFCFLYLSFFYSLRLLLFGIV